MENLKIISEEEVPKRGSALRPSKWDKVFDYVPIGKAIVIEPKNAIPQANQIRPVLQRRQKQGHHTNLIVRLRGKTTYIINPKKSSDQ